MRTRMLASVCTLLLALAPATAQQAALMAPPMDTVGGPAADGGQLSVSAEYLLWWIKNGPTGGPLLVADTGAGAPTVLYGNRDINYGPFSGGRFGATYWFDAEGTVGLDASGFFLAESTNRASFASDATGSPLLGNPFLNVTGPGPATPDLFEISTPGALQGTATISSMSKLWGTEANLVLSTARDDTVRLTLLGGFRYLDLREGLLIQETSTALDGQHIAYLGVLYDSPASVLTTDAFGTRNEFYGGQLGAKADVSFGRLFARLTGKVALGDVHETVNIAGNTQLLGVTPPPFPTVPLTGQATGPMTSAPGGFYALPVNIGNYNRNRFAVVPDVELKVGYNVTERLSAFVAYNFLYISDVVRPGDQINHAVSLNRVPSALEFNPNTGAAQSFSFHSTDFWAQGVGFGMTLRF